MKSRLTTLVAAAALALSGLAAEPAAAGDDGQKALALILGAVALGVIIHNSEKKRNHPPPAPQPAPQPDPARVRLIPSECVYDVQTGRGPREVVSQRCLIDLGLIRGIPAECAFDISSQSGTRTVYGPRCLEDFGFRIEDARY